MFEILPATIASDIGILLFRLSIGLALLPFGIEKYCERMEKRDSFFAVMGFPPRMSFYIAMLMEIIVPCCVIFGFLTRAAAFAGFGLMAVAFTKSSNKYLASPATSFMLGFITILLVGPGKYSLDYLLITM